MTLPETRQLGIEFERRVQTMIPETELVTKLDTETIYSFLNQYQDKLIHDLYRTVDQIPSSNNQTYIEALLNKMLTSWEGKYSDVNYDGTKATVCTIKLPEDFGLYADSWSDVLSSYSLWNKRGKGSLPNNLISVKDSYKALQKPYDDMKILRSPIVWIGEDKRLNAIYDRYTEPEGVWVEYYKIPKYMDLMTSQECELPMEMFEQLVSGAVDLYVQYVAGAEARKRQLAEQQRQQQKKQEDDK